MPESAPFRDDLAEGPPHAAAFWLTASDGVRIRVAHFPSQGGKGTVFLLPGRTEYIEKYGLVAAALVEGGFHVLAVDWRGQGLSDRLVGNPMVGHVDRFTDYQRDWAAMLDLARELGLPRRWHMMAHSMGGCIGLRALMDGSEMASAVFTGPMWGIEMSARVRPLARALSWSASRVGLGRAVTPGTSMKSYVAAEPFRDNLLTTDPEMYAYMRRQVAAEPRFGLGGPSLHWLHEALGECKRLAHRPSPAVPALCFLGSNERIVDTASIRSRMTHWPGGKLLLVDGAEHEVLMEKPGTRRQVIGSALSLYRRLSRKPEAALASASI